MADNVIVRVPEQQFIRGEDGYSPEVTIENIDHGHSVNITDREHPEGQTFNVLDGDSAYEQAVAGGYTGTEAQFNEELRSFKALSDETKEAAPFYAEYGVTTKAEIETAINGKRQIYVHSALGMDYAPLVGPFLYLPMFGNVPQTGYRFATIEGTTQYIYDLRDEWSTSENDLSAPADRAEQAADQALIRMNSADASAQDAEAYAIGKRKGIDVGAGDPASNNNSKYYMELAAHCMVEASSSETMAASSMRNARNYASSAQDYAGQATSSASDAAAAKTAAEAAQGLAESAQTAAETAQGKAEDAQEAAEAVLASIPSDYTTLSGDVDNLKSAFNADLVPTSWTPNITKGSYFKIADGSTGTSNKYARTELWSGYGTRKAIVVDDPTYEFCLALYDETGTTRGTGYLGYIGYATGTLYIPQNAKLFGISFRRVDQTALTDSDITAISAALSALAATDTTLSVAGAPADAKTTGDRLSALSSTKAPAIYNTASGAVASFDDGAEDMPLKGLTVDIEPVQAGSGDPSPDNVRPITGWTGCKLHHTGVSLIGGDAFLGYAFAKTDSGYELTYGGSSVSQRASAYADITGLPAGRYTLQFINYTCPDGCAVTFRFRSPGGSWTTLTIIGGSAFGIRTFTMPANVAQIQFYFSPNTGASVGDKLTVDDVVLMREEDDETPEPYQGSVYNITFPTEAGTVYGGTLDALTGLLTVKWFGLCFDTAEKIEAMGSFTDNRMQIRTSDIPYPRIKNSLSQSCSHAKYQSNAGDIHQNTIAEAQFQVYPSDNRVFFAIPGVDSLQGYKDFATEQMNAGTPLTFVSLVDQSKYITYQLSPIEVATLLGENNIWADTGDVTVTYSARLETIKDYADRVGDSILSAIAPLETSYTASRTYTVGSYLFVGTKFYKVTAAIAEGGTITPGTNVTQTTVAEQLMSNSFVILEQPHDVEASIGVDATFSVVARGAAGYVWQYWTPNSQTWRDSSTTTSDYTLEVTEARYTYSYRCKVTGFDGSVIYSQPVKYVRPS